MPITVKQPEPPIKKEILAEAIVSIGKAAKRLSADGLNEAGVIALVYDMTKVPKKSIKTILTSLKRLEAWYCR